MRIALPLRGLFLSTGSSMEEGFMLVFPHRILQGDVPNVDFLHLYGPFSLHVLAGWYRLFGYSLEAQRVFGLLQHLGVGPAATEENEGGLVRVAPCAHGQVVPQRGGRRRDQRHRHLGEAP